MSRSLAVLDRRGTRGLHLSGKRVTLCKPVSMAYSRTEAGPRPFPLFFTLSSWVWYLGWSVYLAAASLGVWAVNASVRFGVGCCSPSYGPAPIGRDADVNSLGSVESLAARASVWPASHGTRAQLRGQKRGRCAYAMSCALSMQRQTEKKPPAVPPVPPMPGVHSSILANPCPGAGCDFESRVPTDGAHSSRPPRDIPNLSKIVTDRSFDKLHLA